MLSASPIIESSNFILVQPLLLFYYKLSFITSLALIIKENRRVITPPAPCTGTTTTTTLTFTVTA
jgi:hypothetical protein